MSDVNPETITGTLSWYKILLLNWFSLIRVKTKSSHETEYILLMFLEPSNRPKVECTDNSMEFGRACEVSSWNHRTSTPHRFETNGIAERAVRWVEEGTSAVLPQSRLVERLLSCSMECYCYLRNVQDLLADGQPPYERRFGEPFKEPRIPFRAMVWIPSDFTEKSSKNSPIWQESITRNLSGCELIAGVNLERRYLDSRPGIFGKRLGASDIYPRRINAKELLIRPKRWWFHLPSSRWYSKIVRKRLRIPRIHSEAGTNRKVRRFQQRFSRRTGRVSTDRITDEVTKFTLLKENPPQGYMWSGKRWTKIQTTTRPTLCMARSLDENW